ELSGGTPAGPVEITEERASSCARGVPSPSATPGAVTGRTPATAARRAHPEHVTRLELHGSLVGQADRRGLVAAGQQPVLPGRAGLAAGEAPRAAIAPLADERQGHVLEHLQV